MLEEFINSLECKKIESGDNSILAALESFDCGNPEQSAYEVSNGMLCRFKEYISGKQNVNDVYYIIWDGTDIFLFFSLQASLVFSDGIISPEHVDKLKTVYKWSCDNEYTIYPDLEIFKGQMDIFYGLQDKYSLDENNFKEVIDNVVKIIKDKSLNTQSSLYVEQSFPSIEMVNFCKNHGVKNKWKYKDFPIGATLFWYKVMPIIREVNQKIGCVYVSLFAADVSPNETDGKRILLSYYENALMFKQAENLRALKPKYDWNCIFLCQKVSELCKKEEDFKKNFLGGLSDDDV